MASIVVSLRVSSEQAKRLQRKARKLGRSPSETGALLLDESLRRDEFSFIDFRDTATGRQAYIQGTRLAVWQIASLVRTFKGSVDKTAEHLSCSALRVQAAMNYAKAFPQEIEHAIEDNRELDFESLKRLLPQAEEFVVPKARR